MIEITVTEFEKNYDDYMRRIEDNQEQFLIRREDGTAVMAVPATDELETLYKNHNEAS